MCSASPTQFLRTNGDGSIEFASDPNFPATFPGSTDLLPSLEAYRGDSIELVAWEREAKIYRAMLDETRRKGAASMAIAALWLSPREYLFKSRS
jgi:hypothetical protein